MLEKIGDQEGIETFALCTDEDKGPNEKAKFSIGDVEEIRCTVCFPS